MRRVDYDGMMRAWKIVVCCVTLLLTALPAEGRRRLVSSPPVYDVSADSGGFVRWSAASSGFDVWERSGTELNAAGELVLDPSTAVSGTDPYGPDAYSGGTFYNGRSFMVGEATSPVVVPDAGFYEAIPSWNATTPSGTWVEVQLRAHVAGNWTKWYNLGVWADDDSTVRSHSVRSQGDANGSVATDTLRLTTTRPAGDAFQLRLRLFSETGVPLPAVRNASVATSERPPSNPMLLPGNPSLWNRVLDLPECSQMVYPDGGTVWCSPTSTAMVVAFLTNDRGPCEPRVRAATNGTWDWIYRGYGNWPFNTAYAATFGLDAYVARFTSMRAIEAWVASGVPVIISFAWAAGELEGAAIASSAGHLAVVVGFDADGDPIVNDPAASEDGSVRRTYRREELERLWLRHSGGTAYLIYRPGTRVPRGH
jgi:hypothetical protein